MLEELLGKATLPLVITVSVIAICLTAYSINESNQKEKTRQTCIDRGGKVGNTKIGGHVTCELPK